MKGTAVHRLITSTSKFLRNESLSPQSIMSLTHPHPLIGHSPSTAIANLRPHPRFSIMPCTGTTSTPPATMPFNVLEQLPTEIRYMVYSLLGYPINTKIWLDCPGPPHCTDKSHIIFHEDAKWPMTWHDVPGNFEGRTKIKQLSLQKPRGGDSKMLKLQVKFEMGNQEVNEN